MPAASKSRRRILGWAAYAILLLVFFEGASALFVTQVLPRFKPYYFADFYDRMVVAISDDEIAAFARERHDPDLGWDYRPGERTTVVDEFGRKTLMTTDVDGARTLAVAAGPELIAAYGDSFTAGSGVNDDETWPFHLSRLTGTRVRNFGVAAFGPDQALLKLERNFGRGLRARIVILAIIPDDLNRLVNLYRPFYARAEPGLTFKPMFRERAGTMELVNLAPQPLASRASVMRAFEQAKRYDHWYSAWARGAVAPGFPYLLTVVRALILRPILKRADSAVPPESTQVLRYLLRRFAAHAAVNRYDAVFVIIPETGAELVAGQSRIDAGLVAQITVEFAGQITIVDLARLAAEHPIEPDGYNIRPDRGHLSPDGNRLVATLLGGQLRPLIERARQDAASEP